MRRLLLLLAGAAPAVAGEIDPGDFRNVAVLEAGRKKPLETFAREKIEFITGKAAWKGDDPVATLLSMVFEPQKWETVELIKVSHPGLVELLGKRRDGRLANVFSPKELLENAAFAGEVEKLARSEERPTGAREKAVEETWAKLRYFEELGAMLKVVPPAAGAPGDDWHAIVPAGEGWSAAGATRALYAEGWLAETEKLWGELAAAVRSGDGEKAKAAMAALAPRLAEVNPERYPRPATLKVETAFMRWQPFRIAWIVYALACLGFAARLAGLKKAQVAGFSLMCAGFAAHLAGVGMRAYVAQRAPWADLYEAMVVVCLMCVVFAIVFEAMHRSAYVGLSASFMAAVGLIGAAMLPFDFRTIDPLVPVLRSWWLKYHVLSMISSYGAFTLAFGVSAIHLYMHFVQKNAEASKKLEDLTYRVIQVGFFFITVGIILGAVWADSAWGRYWGWDPKEIWALVSWFIYGAYIHGRMIGWCRGPRAAGASVLGYAAILFTFFGVNFVLTGLHSYANAS